MLVKAGARASAGGNTTVQALEQSVEIPGMFNFFRVGDTRINLVDNERFEPEQVLTVTLSTPVDETELRKNFAVYLLPKEGPKGEKSTRHRGKVIPPRWSGPGQVDASVLAASEKLPVALIPNELDASDTYNFKFSADVGRQIYFTLNKGTKSAGAYLLAQPYLNVLDVPPYQQSVKIMHQGAILSLAGERKLSIMARSTPAIKFEIGRVIPGQMNHLVMRMANFQNPALQDYTFNEDAIVERFTATRGLASDEVTGGSGAKTQYTSIDFGRYLNEGESASNKRGLFLLKVRGWDPEEKRETGSQDARFILVTDLGFMVKKLADRSQVVFVQSIKGGTPVAGARVEIIGRNGLPVVTATTDASGTADIPDLKDFTAEKEPVGYVVRHGNDLSFMPYRSFDRTLNYSRFDTGGVEIDATEEKLTAYLFSERGIYRPGDEFHVGMIVRGQDWQTPLDGVPVEAEVTDARGVSIYKEKLKLSREGFLEIAYRTEETSPTGSYTATLYTVKDGLRGGFLGSTTLRVEEFLPDQMKIHAALSSQAAEGWVSPEGIKGLVSLRNLFGTPAESRRVTGSISLSPVFPSFRKWKDYQFHDPLLAKRGFDERLPETETNEKGEAEFDLDLARFEKASYRLTFYSEGFAAAGGRAVSAAAAVSVSPLKHMVGFKPESRLDYLKKDSVSSVQLVAVGPNVEAVELPGVEADLIEIKYVSVLTKQNDGTFKYESVKKEKSVSKQTITLAKGGLKYPLPTKAPGDFAIVLREGGSTELNRIDFHVAGKTNAMQKLEKSAELGLKLSKTDYGQDEEIELEITAPYTGSGLITIEREKVFAHKWFKTTTTSSVQRIRVPRTLEGGGYVNVAFVRGLDSREIFTSPLSYGVAAFSVSRARRTNPVELTVPELIKPGETLKIGYQAKQAGKIAIFAIDEGILQVAAYKTPDPLAHFFKKRALQVETRQLLDLILPEFSVVKAVSATGGDADESALGKNLNPFKRKRDKPVAYWSGIIDADTQPHEITYVVPDYFNGTIRVMAVAVSESAVGVAESKLAVRGDFVITPNVPLLATPGDEIEIGVAVANNVEGSGPSASVKLKLATSEHLEVIDGAERTLTVGEGRESSTHYRVRAKNHLGSANLTFVATSGKTSGRASIDLSLRPSQPYVTLLTSGFVRSGSNDVAASRKMYPNFRTREVAVSLLPLGLSHGLIKFLTEYPYGCTEQLVSKAFPAVVLRNRPEFGFAPDKVEKNLKETIRVLRSRQNADGAFGVWAAESQPSMFYTAYAYHFLTEAKEKGHPVPKELVERVEDYAKALLKKDPAGLWEARFHAYFAYLLARNGILVTNDLAALRKQVEKRFKDAWKTDLTAAYLAATYSLYKQDSEARNLFSGLKMGLPQQVDYEHYYDRFVFDAQYLYLAARHFPAEFREIKGDQIQAIVQPIVEGSYNTISSSYAILALDAYVAQVDQTGMQSLTLTELLAGGKQNVLQIPQTAFPKLALSNEAEKLRLAESGGLNLFYQLTEAGFDLSPPLSEMRKKIEVFREITDENGSQVSKASLGEQYFVHVRVRALERGGVPHAAIVDMLPSGFEVVMERSEAVQLDNRQEGSGAQPQGDEGEGEVMHESEGDEGARNDAFDSLRVSHAGEYATRSPAGRISAEGTSWEPEYVDVREDRVLLFGHVSDSSQEFVYKVRAVNKGSFNIPPIYAESMYDRTVQARGLGGKIGVEGK
ncbi:MAG TPA: alpha-2-macroglobulin [Bdellovibrionota bacterium]|nr:alpha-2-macroglobulin [Bdellovibrionota bacterium]